MEALVKEWDAVVIDEAHKVAKPHQETLGPDPTMQRYRLGKKLADNTDHLLLLSATPHNGYRDTFASLKKTCRKLGISFWEFLKDRILGENKVPYLPDLIISKAQLNSH